MREICSYVSSTILLRFICRVPNRLSDKGRDRAPSICVLITNAQSHTILLFYFEKLSIKAIAIFLFVSVFDNYTLLLLFFYLKIKTSIL